MTEEFERSADLTEEAARGLEAARDPADGDRRERATADLIETIAALSSPMDLEQVLQVAAEQMCRRLAVEACAISKWDPETDELKLWIEYVPEGWQPDPDRDSPVSLEDLPVIQAVVHQQKVIYCRIDDPELDPAERAFMSAGGIQSLLMLPLIVQERSVGLIRLMDRRQVHIYSAEQVSLGQLLANQTAIAIERAQLLAEARQRAAELEAIRKASLSLTASLDLPEVLDAILVSTMTLIPDSEGAHVFLYEQGRLNFGAALWDGGRKRTPFAEPRLEGLTYSVARTGEAIVVEDMPTHPLFADAPSEWTGSIVGLPLKISSRVVGVMNVASTRPKAFSDSELRVLRLLADQAAIAIENARLHDLVIRQAQTDTVTGLANRRALNERLSEEVRRARRYEGVFTLVMMDLDNFKLVNDSFGHPAGDKVLDKVGACLQQVVRDSDFLARFGGDEFALLLMETGEKAALEMVGRINPSLAVCELGLPPEWAPPLSFSVGLAAFPLHGEAATSLLVAADNALYQAKASGPGKIISAGDLPAPESG